MLAILQRQCSFFFHCITSLKDRIEWPAKTKKITHSLLFVNILVFMNWQQGNAQSHNTEQVRSLKNTVPFVFGRLTNYLLCGAGKSPSNSALVGLRGKPPSQIKLGSNVWTSYSNGDHLA